MIRPVWRKSTFCNGASTCVEVAPLPDGWVAVRDAKEQDGPVLIFSGSEFAAFIAGVKAGEFDPDKLRERMDGSDMEGSPRASGLPLAAS